MVVKPSKNIYEMIMDIKSQLEEEFINKFYDHEKLLDYNLDKVTLERHKTNEERIKLIQS
jgi:hypothetical protein